MAATKTDYSTSTTRSDKPTHTVATGKFRKRQTFRRIAWLGLPLTIVLGVFYPILGFAVLGCMLASIGVSFTRGRAWCDVCPRGSFLDLILGRISRNRAAPAFLRSTWFRVSILGLLMTVMTVRLVQTWGNPSAMGGVFWFLLAITTAVGIVLAIFYKPRTWCTFCPMGSMASWIGRKKIPLAVSSDSCVQCGVCAKVCPLGLYAGASKECGMMMHGDCTKCMRCVVSCPKNALSFDSVARKP